LFTGIIEQITEITELRELDGGLLRVGIRRPAGFEVQHGDSVAVDGCCLTVCGMTSEQLDFDVSRETLARTTLGSFRTGASVNIERALSLGGRLGGHLVLGHVDGVGQVSLIEPNASGWRFGVEFNAEHAELVIPKGSIAIQGISLTINHIRDLPGKCAIELMLIPTTLEKTTLGRARVGQQVNLEFDLLGKYILRSKQIETAKN
jgi:riboflavin synthase